MIANCGNSYCLIKGLVVPQRPAMIFPGTEGERWPPERTVIAKRQLVEVATEGKKIRYGV